MDFDVLNVVARVSEPLSARQIWTLADRGSESGVRRAADRLVGQGVLGSRRAGNATLYWLNRDHLAAPAALMLSDLRGELLRRLGSEFEQWSPSPTSAALFGSVARTDGGRDSDIDLFLLRPRAVSTADARWREQVDRLHDSVLSWTGNPLGVFEVDETELSRLPPDLRQALLDDAVDLAGTSIRTFLREA